MDYAKALTFITEDPRWKEKMAIGAGVALISMLLSFIAIGFLGFLILAGYSVRLMQNVRDGKTYPLPEWDAWGEDLVRGFKILVVSFVWALPAILFMIPVGIGGAMADGRGAAETIGGLIVFCGTCLMAIYGLFVALVTPGFTIGFATDERVSSGLQFTKIWNWTQENIGQVVIAAIVIIVASIAIALVGSIVGALLCVVGLVVTLPLAVLVTSLYQYHIYGQLAHEYPYDDFGGKAPVEPPADWIPQSTDLAVTPAQPEVPAVPETPAPEANVPAEDVPAEDAPSDEIAQSDESPEQPPAA